MTIKKNKHDWLKISLFHEPFMSEAVAEALFNIGAEAIWEDLPDQHGRTVSRAGFSLEEKDTVLPLITELMENIQKSFESNTPLEFEYNLETNTDWTEKWKEGLEPIIIQDKLAIKPTWWLDEINIKAKNTLNLDPGMAFGTGHHPTTYLCLEALVEILPNKKIKRILDLGAGSGILALSAALLSKNSHLAPEIIGLDNDPETINVAQENALLNHLENQVDFSTKNLEKTLGHFDLILANITQNPLLMMKNEITSACNPEGIIVLSGLLDAQIDSTLKAYTDLNFSLQKILKKEEWVAIILKPTLLVL